VSERAQARSPSCAEAALPARSEKAKMVELVR
jgi:hypothetical protein